MRLGFGFTSKPEGFSLVRLDPKLVSFFVLLTHGLVPKINTNFWLVFPP